MAQALALTKSEFQKSLRQLLKRNYGDCKILMAAYDKAETCAEDDTMVKKLALEFDPKFSCQVKQCIADLKAIDRPILVLGENSTVKNSFLNLLIGRKILLEMPAPSTHCICCIKKGETLEAHVSSVDGSTPKEIISGDGMTDDDFRGKLKDLMNEDVKSVDRCIDIFVQSEMLEDNVYFVDITGFGDTGQNTQLLLQYLPKAIGIIFLMNPTVSLGIRDERTMNEIKRLMADGEIPSFAPENVIFIANGLDQIVEEEKKNNKQKLKSLWPYFEEKQLLSLSVKLVLEAEGDPDRETEEKYKSAIDEYKKVLDEIRGIVDHCARATSRIHTLYLSKFLSHLKTCLDAVDAFSKLSPEEAQTKTEFLQQIVAEFEVSYKEGEMTINDLSKVTDEIAKEVHQYLNKADNKKKIFTWKSDDLPKGESFENIREHARAFIRQCIAEAIANYIESLDSTAKLRKQISKLLPKIKEKEARVKRVFQKFISANERPKQETQYKLPTKYDHEDFLSIHEVMTVESAIAVWSSPLWVPIGLAGLIATVPVRLGKSIANQMEKSGKVKRYKKEAELKHEKWTQEILVWEYNLDILEDTCNCMLLKKVREYMENFSESIKKFKNLSKSLDQKEQTEVVLCGYTEVRNLRGYLQHMLPKSSGR